MGQFAALSLLQFDPPRSRNFFGFLRQIERQDAVFVFRGDVVRFDVAEVKGSAVGAVGTLAAQILAVFLFVFMFAVAFSREGQDIIGNVEVDILLFEARKICFDPVGVALVGDVGLKGSDRSAIEMREEIAEKASFKNSELSHSRIKLISQVTGIFFEVYGKASIISLEINIAF